MSYKKGNWLAICDRCGLRFKSDQMKQTWDGLMVDASCWEPRQPQTFVKGVREFPAPYARPKPVEELQNNPYDYFYSGYFENPLVARVPTNYITRDGVELP